MENGEKLPADLDTDHIEDSDENELVGVVTPSRSLAPSRAPSRPPSRPPSRSGTRRTALSPLKSPRTLDGDDKPRTRDPLRALNTEINQRVFSLLSIRDLARCTRVCKRWSKSQTLNYVWFQHYRKENFHDESLPPGKWTKRESKQNWLSMYAQHVINRSPTLGPVKPPRATSGWSTPGSGAQTPREVREERWRLENQAIEKPDKQESREKYKELGGRKSRTKGKLGSSGTVRDKGGWAMSVGGDDDYY
ncbi:hypothetical protein K488DRAFT_78822 [Vararia minispora EC-137]|uniref:Uncharacterized protein n=1 Tax=Vararia minispora EC-137 TaxID=1314806 RepID=A0ACB8QJ45_9AGAM|nr:hypothetical protein K488DRAFT_78822 [Vararia minispora EC-137]